MLSVEVSWYHSLHPSLLYFANISLKVIYIVGLLTSLELDEHKS